MSTREQQGSSVATGGLHFFVEPTILAEPEVRFKLEEHSFRLPCQVMHRLAPTPQTTLEYKEDPAARLGADARRALSAADGSEIPAFIVSDLATVEVDVHVTVDPFFGIVPGDGSAHFMVTQDRTPTANVPVMHETTFSIINMHVLTNNRHTVSGQQVAPTDRRRNLGGR